MKMDKINTKMDDAKKEVEEAYAAGTSQALRDDSKYLSELQTYVNNTINDIRNSAAQREVKARVEALVDAAAAVTYDASKYTAGDAATIKNAINNINNWAHTEDNNGILDGDNLTNWVSSGNFNYYLGQIQNRSNDLDEAKRIIAEEILEPEPEVIPGDITGTGEVTDDDFDQFVEDLLAGNVPEPGDPNFAVYDANGDGEINVGDIQAIFNLSMGLNPDGSDPDAAGVRARAYGIFDAGNMAVEATKLSNGNTMLAVKLSSTTDYLAFQMDVVMGDGMSVVSENANLQLLRSNDLSNIHRIVGYGLLENNGTMLTLEVAGEGNVQFTNIVLATEKAEAVKFNLGGTTGISTIAVEKNDGNFIYDLSGKLMNGIKKGINIIRGKNGETKKVVK
jgi:hypothetical protein